jgi:hypothetical protein
VAHEVKGRALNWARLIDAAPVESCVSLNDARICRRGDECQRSLLYFLVGIVRHVFPLDLNQVPTLSSLLLSLRLAFGIDYDYRLLAKL